MPAVSSPLKNYDLILNNWWQLKRCPNLLLKAWQLSLKSSTLFPQNILTVSQLTVSRHLHKTCGTDLFNAGQSKIQHNIRHHATSNIRNEISLRRAFKSIQVFSSNQHSNEPFMNSIKLQPANLLRTMTMTQHTHLWNRKRNTKLCGQKPWQAHHECLSIPVLPPYNYPTKVLHIKCYTYSDATEHHIYPHHLPV